MKSFRLSMILMVVFSGNIWTCFAQTSGIVSGTIYTIKSKSNNKLLDVSNSSMDNNAVVDCWTDTRSDAERWIVTYVGSGLYTLANVASGKLLHAAPSAGDTVHVDQYNESGGNDVKWAIKKAGKDLYYLKSAHDPGFSLNLTAGGTEDGIKVNLSASSVTDSQQWLFQKQKQQNTAPALSIANEVFDAWYTNYNIETGKGFWDQAEMMEILLDAYEVTSDARFITRFNKLYDHFIAVNQADWMYNKYNDDITWAVLFCVRGYILTGNRAYLEKGKNQFDQMYARAFTNSYGGGLIWYETKTSKNACINGPAMVASCYLAQATGDKSYYDKAIALYTWSKLYLFNPATGKVADNVDFDKSGKIKISLWSSTYNQGTYLAAATMLYDYTKELSYLAEAEKIAQYTRDNMYNAKVMNNEDGGNDLPGFKGIFARYARKYTMNTKKTDLVEWLLLNARVAYNNRNSQSLIQTKWATRTSESKPKSAFGSSTAVSLLMNSLVLKN
ncbi:MAG: hypothetical protein JWR67_3539 [Mucilaginibacter sp.]|nr:hypothetical protein [Mucilaginibacter sp.]